MATVVDRIIVAAIFVAAIFSLAYFALAWIYPCLVYFPRALCQDESVDVVVAAHDENLDWVEKLRGRHQSLKRANVTVYAKGAAAHHPSASYHVARLPNVGRCDHTYLYHIVQNYNRLADVTVFATGSTESLFPKRVTLDYIILPRLGSSARVLGRATRTMWGGLESFSLSEYCSKRDTEVLKTTTCKMVPSALRPFGAWWRARFGTDRPLPTVCVYGGVFSARLEAIRSVPLDTWRTLLEDHIVGESVEVGHYMERSWYELLR